MTEQPQVPALTADALAQMAPAEVQAARPPKVYDSVAGPGGGPVLPQGADYAMLYADRQPRQYRWQVPPDVKVRWITERGNSAYFCLDYELGTPVYQQPQEVRRFFDARLAAGERGLLYCQRSLLSQVHSYVGASIWTSADFLLWLPTLDNRQWTAAELQDDLARNWGVSVREAQVWGNQYATSPDSGGAYDVSNLFGAFD